MPSFDDWHTTPGIHLMNRTADATIPRIILALPHWQFDKSAQTDHIFWTTCKKDTLGHILLLILTDCLSERDLYQNSFLMPDRSSRSFSYAFWLIWNILHIIIQHEFQSYISAASSLFCIIAAFYEFILFRLSKRMNLFTIINHTIRQSFSSFCFQSISILLPFQIAHSVNGIRIRKSRSQRPYQTLWTAFLLCY